MNLSKLLACHRIAKGRVADKPEIFGLDYSPRRIFGEFSISGPSFAIEGEDTTARCPGPFKSIDHDDRGVTLLF